jgi:hypothetical protein
MDCRNARIARFGDGLEPVALPLRHWHHDRSHALNLSKCTPGARVVCAELECIHFSPHGKILHSSHSTAGLPVGDVTVNRWEEIHY